VDATTAQRIRSIEEAAMRALFTPLAVWGLGHFLPLVPVAAALRDAGHTVAFAVPESFTPHLATAGFDAVTAGASPTDAEVAPLLAEVRAITGTPEGRAFTRTRLMAGVFAGRLAADLIAIAPEWRPDIIIRDAAGFGGCLAAEALGLPHAMVIVHVARGDGHYQDDLVAPLDARRAALGLPPDPHLAMLSRYLVLDFAPPGYRDPAYAPPTTLHTLRFALPELVAYSAPPTWLADLPPRPTVYVGLGTATNPRRPALFAAILAGLRDEQLNVIVTVGNNLDPAQFGPQPPHIRVERFIPLAYVLPRCNLVVCHGGSGTTLAALAHGLPLVIVPMAADMPDNAERCEALGVGQERAPDDCTPEAVREHVRAILADAAYRTNAERIRDATAALPGMERAVELLERLAREKQPIVA
jgi:UDP:flavonoid glycosyltransferase YjiC (YdhE family)